jgi:hypothetical protein
MPSRKQRRRREKLQRHEWELVQIEADGTERPLEPAPSTDRTPAPRGRAKTARTTRPAKAVKAPSWQRAAKRALLFAPFLFVFLSIGKNPPPVAARLSISVLYAAIFIPMFFFIDRLTYRAYKRRVPD